MLLRQTLLYLPAQVIGPIVQFLSLVLWTYFLDPVEMGVFALIMAAQELAYTATLFYFTIYSVRYFDKSAGPREQAAFFNTESAAMLVGAVVSTGAVALMPLFTDVSWSGGLGVATFVYTFLRTIGMHLPERVRAATDTLSYTVMQVALPIIGLALGIALVKAWGPTAANVIWGYAIGQLVALVPVLSRIGIGRHPLAFSPETLRAARRYGLPLVAGGLCLWLANNGLRFVIERQEGPAGVGVVTVGWGLGLRAATFAAMLVTAAGFPLAVARTREGGMAEGQAQLVRNGVLLFAILAPSAAGLWAIATPLVDLIVAAPFREMTAAVLPWAILAGSARNFRVHFGQQVFLLREETHIPLLHDIFDAIATVIGGIIGLAHGGLIGSVQGAAIASLASLLLTFATGAVRHGFGLPFAHFLRIGGATIFMFLVLQAMPIQSGVVSLAVAVTSGMLTYALGLALAYPHDARLLLSRLRRGELL